jgi:hypothetical protein
MKRRRGALVRALIRELNWICHLHQSRTEGVRRQERQGRQEENAFVFLGIFGVLGGQIFIAIVLSA